MTRGTTPIITFEFPANYSNSDEVELTFSQDGEIVLTFYKGDITFSTQIDGQTTHYLAQITLQQEEVNMFRTDKMVEVQFRFKIGSTVSSTGIKKIPVNRILNDEVL